MQTIKNITLFILSFVLYIFLNLEFSLLVINLNLANKYINVLILILGNIFTCLTLILLYLKQFQRDIKNFNKNGKDIIKTAIKVWLIGIVLMMLFNFIIGSFVGTIASNEAANRTIINKNFTYAIISMVITAPICEEILFRLSLGNLIKNNYLFYIASGLIFGYVHVMSTTGLELLYIIPYATLGLCFAYLYRKTDNIFSTISMHMLHNLLCIILIIL